MKIDCTPAFIDALTESRLLEADQLEEVRRLQERFPEPADLADELIRRGWLTSYQANQIFKGLGRKLVLDQYVVLELLGEGGMGQVFKARHRRMDRVVAVKVILKEQLSNPKAIHRFEREIKAAAQLSHPNVVIAYDANEVANTYFFVMEYLEGTDLAHLVLRQGPLPAALACDYIRQSALGLQHAHERGLVHRDIKPSNLFLTAAGNVVKVLDMGLARLREEPSIEDSPTQLTREGMVMGTPDYMAPEQAVDSHKVDIRADIYSLGCSLYYLLAGRAPFPQGTAFEKLFKHRMEEPEPIRNLRPDLSEALAAVLRKAMAKQREERYQTPGELAAALAPFCQGAAEQGGLATAAISPAGQIEALAPTGTIASASPPPDTVQPGLVSPDTSGWSDSDDDLQKTAVVQPPPVMTNTPHGRMTQAAPGLQPTMIPTESMAASVGGLRPAGGAPSQWAPIPPPPVTPPNRKPLLIGAALALLAGAGLATPLLLNRLGGNGTSNGTSLATTKPEPEVTRPEKPVPPEVTKPTPLRVRERYALLVGVPHYEHGELSDVPSAEADVNELSDLLQRAGYRTGNLVLMTATRGKADPRYQPRAGNILTQLKRMLLDLADEGDTLLVALAGHAVQFRGDPATFFCPADARLADKGNLLAFADLYRELGQSRASLKLLLVDAVHRNALAKPGAAALEPLAQPQKLPPPKDTAVLFAASDGEEGLVADKDGKRGVFFRVITQGLEGEADDGDKAVLLPELMDFTKRRVKAFALTELEKQQTPSLIGQTNIQLALVNTDRIAPPAAVVKPEPVKPMPPVRPVAVVKLGEIFHLNEPFSVSAKKSTLSPDGARVAMSHNNQVRVWDLDSPDPVSKALGTVRTGLDRYKVTSLAFSSDGQRLLFGSQDRWEQKKPYRDMPALYYWDLRTRDISHVLFGHDKDILCTAFAPNGLQALSGGEDRTVRLWEIDKEKQLHSFSKHTDWVTCVQFTPDGRRALSGSRDKTVRYWDLKSFEELAVFAGHENFVTCLAVSPGGDFAVSGSMDETLRLWHLGAAQGKPGQVFSGHNSAVTCVAVSPDGRSILSGSQNGKVCLWDRASGNLKMLDGFGSRVVAVTFSRDGHYALSVSEDDRVRRHELPIPTS